MDSGIGRADPQSLFDVLQARSDQLATLGDGSLQSCLVSLQLGELAPQRVQLHLNLR